MYYKKKNMSWGIVLACGLAFGVIGSSAAPIKTVPWNGHIGAVSFTFDDALETQALNMKPLLDAMPDVHVTFFLTGYQNRFMDYAAGFAALAHSGNEIGNHTVTHWHLYQESDSELEEDVVRFADVIEAALAQHGADVKIVSFATPFCENSDHVKTFINKRHFINRDCGLEGRNNWNVEPDWMNIDSKIWAPPGTTINEMLSAIDTAAYIGTFENTNPLLPQITDGSWLVILMHDVSDNPTIPYVINPDEIKILFERAVKNKLWVAPLGTIGAYHRAHFIFDKAPMQKIDGGYSVKWEIPHKYMPQSVPLRVRIDTTQISDKVTIEQDGKIITPENDGTYIIEFMSKSLILRNAGEISLPITAKIKQNKKAYRFTLFDLKGKPLGKVNDFVVPESYPKGMYIIRAVAEGMPTVTKKIAR